MIRNCCFALIAASSLLIRAAETADCYPLHADEIRASDLAVAVPSFASLPPDLRLGYSPVPGVRRTFGTAELQQLARRFGIADQIKSPVCLSWALTAISKKQIEDAISRSLPDRKFELEIADQSHFPVPEGELTLPLQGLTGESDRPVVWNGYVTYGGTRRIDTWVRVKITLHEDHLIALRSLNAGEIIDDSVLGTIHYNGPLKKSEVFTNRNDALGKSVRWNIIAGSTLVNSMLLPPQDVEKRQLVTVHVFNGRAHLETQGIADDGGYKGSVIRVRNVNTGRIFRARIDDHGVVTVVPGGNVGLVGEDGKS